MVKALRKALEAEGAVVKLLSSKLGIVESNESQLMPVVNSLPTVSSVLFYAVFIPGAKESAQLLCADANAILFVKEAYKHEKAIAVSDGGILLLNKALQPDETLQAKFKDIGVIIGLHETVEKAFIDKFIKAIAQHRFNGRPNLESIVA